MTKKERIELINKNLELFDSEIEKLNNRYDIELPAKDYFEIYLLFGATEGSVKIEFKNLDETEEFREQVLKLFSKYFPYPLGRVI